MIHKKHKVGNVYTIPLPNGCYAFGRLFQDNIIAVYHEVGDSPLNAPSTEDYQFFVGVYSSTLNKWKVIGYRPFLSDSSAWAPPMLVIDPITKAHRFYFQGSFHEATVEDQSALEPAAVWEEKQIIMRILGDNTWKRWFPDYYNYSSP